MTVGVRVLVVDDEGSIRTVLQRWIELWGYDVASVATADDAITEMERMPAEVIFADINMPIHDGIWLLDQVHQRWPKTQVIMESGVEESSTVLKARQHGAVDFLAKPFGREMVYQALERAIARLLTDRI
jgi:DNA-binding NtrC family response regulator